MSKENKEMKYEVVEKVGVLYDGGKGYTKELRLVSWNGGKPKVDIRNWTPNGPGKGISLSMEEAKQLAEYLDGVVEGD